MRRHLTALLLTPTRLVIAHTDEHPGDDYTLRVSAAAEGSDAVAGLLAFSDALSARTRG